MSSFRCAQPAPCVSDGGHSQSVYATVQVRQPIFPEPEPGCAALGDPARITAEDSMTSTGRRVDLTGPQASWPAAALALWRGATVRVLALRDSWHPAPVQGDRRLREVLGAILGDDPDRILITSGVRAGASVIARDAQMIRHERPSFMG